MDFNFCEPSQNEFRHLLPQKNSNPHKKAAITMVAVGIFMLAGFFQVINWDKYSLEVIPLKASTMFGMATESDYGRLAQICLERKKYSCSLSSLATQVQMNPKNLEARLQLGFLQVKTQDLKGAVSTLSTYLKNGGEEPRARYELGKAYAKLGQSQKALGQFKKLLRAKSGVFQVSVTREYVNTLMQAKRWSQAKRTIERARRKSVSYNAFMTAEYKVILKHLGVRRGLASQ